MNVATMTGAEIQQQGADAREHELVAEVLELHEASELEGFLPLLLGPIFSGLRALAPIVMKAAVPALKSIGSNVLPKITRGFRARKRQRAAQNEVSAEHEGFLPIIGSLVSGLLGGELEAEHEVARRYVRLARLAGRRAARRIMALVEQGERPTFATIRKIVVGAIRASADTLYGEPSREMALAQELLEIHDPRELEHFLGALIGPALSALGSLAPIVAKAATPMLTSVAANALPGLGEVAAEAEGEGQELEGFLGTLVGGLLGGELAQEYGGEKPPRRRARSFVRVARAASRRAASELTAMIKRGRQPDWLTIRRVVANAVFAAARGGAGGPGSPADGGVGAAGNGYGGGRGVGGNGSGSGRGQGSGVGGPRRAAYPPPRRSPGPRPAPGHVRHRAHG